MEKLEQRQPYIVCSQHGKQYIFFGQLTRWDDQELTDLAKKHNIPFSGYTADCSSCGTTLAVRFE